MRLGTSHHRRFALEASDGENAGLDGARSHLEAVKAKHPWCSHSDIWVSTRRVLVLCGQRLVIGTPHC